MLNQLRSLAKSTVIYSFGNVSTKLVGFILLPILTNPSYLSIDSYGLLGLFEGIVQLFIAVFGLGLYNGLFRWFYEDKSKQGILTFTILGFVILISGLGVFIGLIGQDFFTALLFKDPVFKPAYEWMLYSAALQTVAVLPVTLMRIKNDAKLFSITSIIRLLIVLVTTLYTLIVLESGLVGVFQAQVLGQIVFLMISLPYIVKRIDFGFDQRVVNVILSYSIPIMMSSSLGILINFVDRFIINSFSGLEEVGIYALAVKLSNFIKVFVISTVSLSLTPILFKKINERDHKRFYSKTMTYYGYGILLVIMLVSMFSYEVIKVFTGSKAYWEAYLLVPVLSLSLYFVALKTIGLMGLHISKKMWYLTFLSVTILVLNIALNIFLIPLLGSIGAAYAYLFCQALLFFVGYLIAQKLYHIPFELSKIIVMPLLAAGLIYAGLATNTLNVWIRIFIKLLLIISFPWILYLGGFYEEIERKRIFEFYQKWKNPKNFFGNLKQLLIK